MRRMALPVELPAEEVRFLGEIADEKHCTLNDMIEEAVARHVEVERRKRLREV